MEALNERAKSVKGSRILLMGLAYKEDVDDMRESPTFDLMDQLAELGAEISYYDLISRKFYQPVNMRSGREPNRSRGPRKRLPRLTAF